MAIGGCGGGPKAFNLAIEMGALYVFEYSLVHSQWWPLSEDGQVSTCCGPRNPRL